MRLRKKNTGLHFLRDSCPQVHNVIGTWNARNAFSDTAKFRFSFVSSIQQPCKYWLGRVHCVGCDYNIASISVHLRFPQFRLVFQSLRCYMYAKLTLMYMHILHPHIQEEACNPKPSRSGAPLRREKPIKNDSGVLSKFGLRVASKVSLPHFLLLAPLPMPSFVGAGLVFKARVQQGGGRWGAGIFCVFVAQDMWV